MSEATFTRIESGRLSIRRFDDSALAPFMAYRNDTEEACYQAQDFVGENPGGRRLAARYTQVPAGTSGPCGRSADADRGGDHGAT